MAAQPPRSIGPSTRGPPLGPESGPAQASGPSPPPLGASGTFPPAPACPPAMPLPPFELPTPCETPPAPSCSVAVDIDEPPQPVNSTRAKQADTFTTPVPYASACIRAMRAPLTIGHIFPRGNRRQSDTPRCTEAILCS